MTAPQRGCVVDSIAEEPDHGAGGRQRPYDPVLMQRFDLGEHRRVPGPVGELVIGQALEVRPEHRRAGEPDLPRHHPGGYPVVARDQAYRDAQVGQVAHGLGGAGLRPERARPPARWSLILH
jgi:hypothetical protein